MRLFYLFTFLLPALLLAGPVHAQLAIPTLQSPITLTTNPASPTPNSIVHIHADSSSFALENADVSWFVDGTLLQSGIGITEVEIQSGSIGSATRVSFVANTLEGVQVAEEITLRPTFVSIVWEADTYTPPFYRGRALPSAGATIHAEAIVQFVRSDGTTVPSESLIYTWKKNGRTLTRFSGRSKSSVMTEGPQLFGEDFISVEVTSIDNVFSGEAIVRIPHIEPHLALYREDPLLGVQFNNALKQNNALRDVESNLFAVPYYSTISTPQENSLTYSWNVNGQRIASDPTDPHRLVLRLTEDFENIVRVALSVAHQEHFLQSGSGEWNFVLDRSNLPTSDLFARPVN